MTASPENTIAVVVGVERYAIDGWSLDGPALDACKFAHWLHSKGVPKANITLLLSTLDANRAEVDQLAAGFPVAGADRVSVRRALAQGINSVNGDVPNSDLLVVYLGGHGVVDGDVRRLLYADATTDEKLNLNVTQLLKVLRSGRYLGHKHQLVIVDACLNYADDLAWATTMPDESLVSGGRPNQITDQYALFAASPGERAKNLDTLKTGQFSQVIRELLDAATGKCWPPDPITLRNAIEDRFAALLAAGDTEQTPSYLYHQPRAGSETLLHEARSRRFGAAAVTSLRLLTWDEYVALKRILYAAAIPRAVRAIYRDATRDVPFLPPPRNPDDLLSTVESLRAAVAAQPLCRFLVMVAATSDQDTGNRMWDWLAEIAPRYDVDLRELEALDQQLQRRVFLLRVEQDCVADELFQVTAWEFAGGVGHQVAVSGDPWDRTRLAGELSQLVTDVDPDVDATVPLVEFLLPTELLDEDLESLPVRLAGTQRAIGGACPVVVRSLQRLENPQWHQSWRDRWAAMVETGHAYDESAICFVECAPDVDVGHGVCAVFAYERGAEFSDDDPVLTAALGGGTPVIVWHRPKIPRADRRTVLASVLRGRPLNDLPDVVLRQRSAASGVGAAADHAGKDLVLLWDDPDRVPLELRYGPPKGAA